MPTNVLLIRWQEGWHERRLVNTDPRYLRPRRIEATLGLGAAKSVNETDRIADAQLRLFSVPRVEIQAEIAPDLPNLDATRVPYVGFFVADAVNVDGAGERVVGVTVSEDEQGVPAFSVNWNSLVAEGNEAFAQWLKKMSNGTGAGQFKPSSPTSYVTAGGRFVPQCPGGGGGVG